MHKCTERFGGEKLFNLKIYQRPFSMVTGIVLMRIFGRGVENSFCTALNFKFSISVEIDDLYLVLVCKFIVNSF